MNLTGPAYLTTRTHNNIFKQLKVQWFLRDRVDTIPDNIELKLGCTIIYNNAADNIGVDSYLHIYGKDMQGNLYYKKIIMCREDTPIEYSVGKTSSFRVLEGIFFVRKVVMDNVDYYLLEDKGTYMLLDYSAFNAHNNTTYQSSVYEFNTMFPSTTTILTKVYEKDKLLDITKLKFSNSSDVLWDAEGSSIIASIPPPDIKTVEQRQYIESINGITMTSGAVSVAYSLGKEVMSNKVPSTGGGVFAPVINIPDNASTSGVYIPLKIAGIDTNENVYKAYGFDTSIFTYTWKLEGTPLSWYKSCKEAWVKLSTSKEKPKDILGIAGLTLGVDGNVPTVPALSANVVGFTPEYRLFNAQFTSSNTITNITQDSVMSGSFTIVKKYGKRTYTVKDASDNDDNMAIIIDDDGQYHIPVKQYKSSSKGTLVAKALYDETDPEESTVTIRVESKVDYAPMSGIDSKTDRRFIEKIIGRVIKKGTKTKVYQEHTGIMYFDFREGGDKYDGQFKISYDTSDDAPKELLVKGGRVRIINKGYDIEDTYIEELPDDIGVIYIHAMVNDGNIPDDGKMPEVTSLTAVIELSEELPEEDMMNSYYLLGSLNDGVVTQDHHGGTPLFLFFSDDCF